MIWALLATAWAADRVPVGPGVYEPLYPPTPEEASQPVARFLLAVEPITNAEYARFVAANPRWGADIEGLYADDGYLGDWASKSAPGSGVLPNAPVTRVSWYAARAYCRSVGGRLPTEAEWELAGAASETSWDARKDPQFLARLLAWYGAPTPKVFPPVGGLPNRWGVRDLHGLVWEWVEDFNASLVDVDPRGSDGEARFCGGGVTGANAVGDYAAFMRLALRASLSAESTVRNLGFRCAWGIE